MRLYGVFPLLCDNLLLLDAVFGLKLRFLVEIWVYVVVGWWVLVEVGVFGGKLGFWGKFMGLEGFEWK